MHDPDWTTGDDSEVQVDGEADGEDTPEVERGYDFDDPAVWAGSN